MVEIAVSSPLRASDMSSFSNNISYAERKVGGFRHDNIPCLYALRIMKGFGDRMPLMMSIQTAVPVIIEENNNGQWLTEPDHYFEMGAKLIPALHNRTNRLVLTMNDIVTNQRVMADSSLKEKLGGIVEDIGGYKAILGAMGIIEELTKRLDVVALRSDIIGPHRAHAEVIKVYMHP